MTELMTALEMEEFEAMLCRIFESIDWRLSLNHGITEFRRTHDRWPNVIFVPMRYSHSIRSNGKTMIHGLKMFCAEVPYAIPALVVVKPDEEETNEN